MIKMRIGFLILISIIFMISSCSLEEENTADPVFCTEEARPALEITVLSSSTDEPLTEDIEVVAVDGDYEESLENYQGSSTFVGAYERDGTYTILIYKSGNISYNSINPIIVDKDICHVITERRTIRLRAE